MPQSAGRIRTRKDEEGERRRHGNTTTTTNSNTARFARRQTQIFFHFKEIIIPKIVEEDETLLTMFSRNGWKMAFCKVGSPVLFDIGEFKDHGKVANNIFLVDVEKALLQKKMKRDQEAAKLSAPVSTRVVPASGGGTSWANLAATQAAAPVKTAKLTQEERDWKRYSKYKDIDGKISNLSNPNNADYNPTLATELKEVRNCEERTDELEMRYFRELL